MSTRFHRNSAASPVAVAPARMCFAALLAALAASALLAGTASAAAPDSEEGKTLYYIGTTVAQNLAAFALSPEEQKYLLAGISDTLAGKQAELDTAFYGRSAQKLMEERMAARIEVEKAAAITFVEDAADVRGAEQTDSGLVYIEQEAGKGRSPATSDKVRVHYEGKLRDGSVFDSSIVRGEPVEFPLSGVIPCWREGVAKMKVGGKARLVCPPSIAYGDRGAPPRIPGGAVLSFEVELLEIVE
jgi:FKBP-type peptidyl-prolyl cis-trans isomerase FkpA